MKELRRISIWQNEWQLRREIYRDMPIDIFYSSASEIFISKIVKVNLKTNFHLAK